MRERNLVEILRHQAERLGPRPGLLHKALGVWHFTSWTRYWEIALECGAALAAAGIRPGDRVGLVSENRIEWRLADMGILTAGAVTVSPHASLSTRQIQFELADSGVSWLFVTDQLPATGFQELPELRGIVSFGDHSHSQDGMGWDLFLHQGRLVLETQRSKLAAIERKLGPEDLCGILYTSGTTGRPKGVMLTHGNLVSNCLGMQAANSRDIDGLVLSWLPLSHIFGRCVDHYLNIVVGATVAQADSPESVIENCFELQPSYLSAVPRFYEKVIAATAGPDQPISGRRLRSAFGQRIKWLLCGGAPLSRPVHEAYEAAGLCLYPGYGLTETSPVISFNRPGASKMETVGQPIRDVEVRIADDGEILARGPNVMRGYWNQPDATAEAIVDGWFHTGDLGTLDSANYLRITGRKKELIVLSSGKKAVPSFIEGLLASDPLIDQAAVTGEGKSHLCAVLVPNWPEVRKTLAAAGSKLSGLTEQELATACEVRQLLEDRVRERLVDLSPWEQVRSFVIATRPFTVEAEELTVSMKLRRDAVFAHYAKELTALEAR